MKKSNRIIPEASEASPTPGFASAAKFFDAAAMFPNSLIGEGPLDDAFASEVEDVSDPDREADDTFGLPNEGAGVRNDG